MSLGTKLKEMRLRSFFSQREFARRLGIDRSTYNAWERDRRKPMPAGIKVVIDFYESNGHNTEKLQEEYLKTKES